MAEAGIAPLHGLVLAGGRSERLGRDKAAVVFRGETLLARAVRLLGEVTDDVRVAVRRDQLTEPLRRRFEVLMDLAEGIGPAAGILAAHRLLPDAAWLVMACDMPGIGGDALRLLVARRDPERAATAFRDAAGRPEPLCAIYEPATLARFRVQVEAGGNPSPRAWLDAAGTLLLDAPGPGTLGSVNSPEDLERLGAWR